MDSNSLPMAMELEAFPRVVRLVVLALVGLFVGGFALFVVAGVSSV